MPSTPRSLAPALCAAALLCLAPPAGAISTYFTTQCAPCHSAAVVGSTATTCNGCHAHGTHPSSAKAALNLAGATSAASYAPGAPVSVTITGGYRTGWVRAALFDQDGHQLAISTGPNGMGGGPGFPITLTAPAPSAPGSYTWSVGWYGNVYDTAGAFFGPRFQEDPNNPDHGWELASTNAFTVTAPTAPAIALAPASLDFGAVTLGQASTLPAQVRNTGTADLRVTAVALCTTPPTEAEFSFTTPPVPFTVPPGGSAAVSVTFTAADPDADTGCVAFTSNAANAPVANLAVSATGVAPPTPVADVNPLSLDFGAVTDGTSASRTFTVGNAGTAPLTVTVARAAGTSAEFTAAPAAFTVQPGGSTTVTAAYAPADAGTDVGSLLVQSNDPLQASIPVLVSGTGVAAPTPHLSLSPASLDLGGVTVGGATSLPVQVQDGGAAPLTVSAIAPCAGTSAEFTWSPAAPFTVAAGGATTLTVTYAPTAAGLDAGCLALTSDDPDSPVTTLAVQGTGLAPSAPRLGVDPASLAFGSVTVGLSSARTLTVSNTGTAALSATLARAAGTSGEFTVTPATLTLAPGASALATVTYAPSAAGADTGALAIASNDPATPTLAVPLSGSGAAAPAPAIALDPAALAFGPVVTGATAVRTAALRNQGSATLDVSAIARCAGTSAEFSWTPSAPLQVPPGASATLTVTYAPTDRSTDQGCLAIASDDPASPTVNLALSGSGVAEAAPAIALDPSALDFGTVTIGTTATRVSQVRNGGTAALHVSAVSACAGTSAEFAASPAGPFEVAAGGAAPLTVTYAPADAGADAGCLTVASDDPATPSARLDLAGTGATRPTVAGDVDIDALRVPERLSTGTARTVTPRAELENRSRVQATATARLTAALDGAGIYDQSLPVTLRARDDRTFTFPPLTVPAGASGALAWTLTVDDADPDLDRATARTRLRPGGGGGGDDLAGGGPGRGPGLALAAAGPAGSASAGGCASGGAAGGAGLALLLLLGAARLAPRRRRG